MKNGSIRAWAREELSSCDLGDRRRWKRGVELMAAAALRPGARVTKVVTKPAAQEAGYRFLRNKKFENTELESSISAATRRRVSKMPFVFISVDQSTIRLTDLGQKKDLGPVGRGGQYRLVRGVHVMTSLAIAPSGCPMGLLGQSWWRPSEVRPPHANVDLRPIKERESGLWITAMDKALKSLKGAKCQPWFQLDRAADAQHVLRHAAEKTHWVTIRSAYNRRLAGPGNRKIRGIFNDVEPCGVVELRLSKAKLQELGRPDGLPLTLGVSFTTATLLVTDRRADMRHEVTMNVVRVREQRGSSKRKRIEWILLTTRPVHNFADAKLVLEGYTFRWRIEEFHKTWKTGACNIESSQLRSETTFIRWATIQSTVAARIERLKYLARNEPDRPARDILSRDEIDAAISLSEPKNHKVGDELTIGEAVFLLAICGGYTGNTKQGPPGSITIGRGLERVGATAIGIALGRKM